MDRAPDPVPHGLPATERGRAGTPFPVLVSPTQGIESPWAGPAGHEGGTQRSGLGSVDHKPWLRQLFERNVLGKRALGHELVRKLRLPVAAYR